MIKEILTQEQQYNLIKEVEKDFGKFLKDDFDYSCFATCRDNFALTENISSTKLLNQNLKDNPTFTIAIPTYKRLETLKKAINSAINQNFNEPYEILVVENTDNDEDSGIKEMIEKNFKGKVNYYKNPKNLEMFGNWNRCLSLAQGKWVCLLHSDDEIFKDYLSEMQKVIENPKYSNAILIGCADDEYLLYPKNKKSLRYRIKKWIISNFFKNMLEKKQMQNPSYHKSGKPIYIPPNAILHNKEKCLKIGGYNQNDYPSGDIAFANRANMTGDVFTYRKKLLQHKSIDISACIQPKTILQAAIINPLILSAFTDDKKFVKKIACSHIEGLKQLFHVKNNILREHATKLQEKFI